MTESGGVCFFCDRLGTDDVDVRVLLARQAWALIRLKEERQTKEKQKRSSAIGAVVVDPAKCGGGSVDGAERMLLSCGAAIPNDDKKKEAAAIMYAMHALAVIRADLLSVTPATFTGSEWQPLRRLLATGHKPTTIANMMRGARRDWHYGKDLTLGALERNATTLLGLYAATPSKQDQRASLLVERRALLDELRLAAPMRAAELDQDPQMMPVETLNEHVGVLRREMDEPGRRERAAKAREKRQ